jgi:ribosome-associated protein
MSREVGRVDQETGPEAPSKSARKRAAHDAQRLGLRLVELRAAELEALGLPERLIDALLEAQRITSRAAAVRQRQYIGKLMRELDPALIVAALEERDRRRALDAKRQQRIEHWRTQLLGGDTAALDALLASHPRADRAAFAGLIGQANDARGPEVARITAARELFRALRELESLPPASGATDGEPPAGTPKA